MGANVFTDAILRVSEDIWKQRQAAMKSSEPDLMEKPVSQSQLRKNFEHDDRFRQQFLRKHDASTAKGQESILKELGQ